MKQNPCPVVGEVAKPARIGFDELNSTIEAFCTGVADSMLAVVEQSFLVAPEHLDYLFHGLQTTPHRIIRPGFEEAFGSSFVAVAPELAEVLLDAPGPARLQVELVQGPKRDGFSATAIGILSQPRPFAACQWRRACLGQASVLLFSDSIYRLTEVLGDVKLVMHDDHAMMSMSGSLSFRQHLSWRAS